MSRSSRGCGKCGKAEAFFAEAFPSTWWKSSKRSRRRPPLSISTGCDIFHSPRARRFRRAVEETDIRNGKDSSKVRNRIQTSTDRTDRSRPDHHRAGRARSSDIEKRHRTVARSVSEKRPGGSTTRPPGTPIGGRKREAPTQGGRGRHADGLFKKIASLGSTAEKRRYIDHHRQELGSISKACQIAGLPSSTFYYKPDKQHRKRRDDEDEKLRQQIERIHEEFPGYGYRRGKAALESRGLKWSK